MKHKIKRLIKWFALWLFGSSLCLGLGVSFAYGVPACFTATQICGVTVLIEQYVQSAAVLEKAIALAPDLQQLHLRIEPSNNQSTVASTVALVEAIRAAGYKNNLVFHPNNYKDEADWGCATGDWKCVLKNSLAFMDAVNAQVKANNQEGFSSFSIEQSYLEPQNNADVLVQKSLVVQHESTDGHPITYGYVSPTCSPSTGTSSDLYGPTLFDYGYPQMYNFWKIYPVSSINQENAVSSGLSELIIPQSPPDQPTQENSYSVMDANTAAVEMCDSSGQADSTIACTDNKGHQGMEALIIPGSLRYKNHPTDIKGTVYEPLVLVPTIDAQTIPTIAGFVAETTALNYPSNADCWQHLDYMYFTLSGEPDFLGGASWTAKNISLFLSTLKQDLSKLDVPHTDQMQYAIWGFDMMSVFQASETVKSNLYQNGAEERT